MRARVEAIMTLISPIAGHISHEKVNGIQKNALIALVKDSQNSFHASPATVEAESAVPVVVSCLVLPLACFRLRGTSAIQAESAEPDLLCGPSWLVRPRLGYGLPLTQPKNA
ncbi:MAG: hypothetical protein C4K49_06190 [Candidatus Thorarchaeota archaeon]|nr:MAG: hypothetical protein C4K49_06190 [Candidatus Thorarchaeota archaeon]